MKMIEGIYFLLFLGLAVASACCCFNTFLTIFCSSIKKARTILKGEDKFNIFYFHHILKCNSSSLPGTNAGRTSASTISTGNILLGLGNNSVFGGTENGDTRQWHTTITTFGGSGTLLDILHIQLATGCLDYADLVGFGVVRQTATVGNSLGHF